MLMNENALILLIVVICSICQSIIGVGLVMIGIPTLILSGFSFPHALSICLPGSLIINIFQISTHHKQINKSDIISYVTMSSVYLLFLFYINYAVGISFNKTTAGLILILTGVVGFKSSLRVPFLQILASNQNAANVFTGIIHSISTMGGALLSLNGAARYNDNQSSRRYISGGYLALGLIQLFFYIQHGVSITPTLYSLLSVPIYFASERYLSPYINPRKFKSIIFTVILIYGLLLINQNFVE